MPKVPEITLPVRKPFRPNYQGGLKNNPERACELGKMRGKMTKRGLQKAPWRDQRVLDTSEW